MAYICAQNKVAGCYASSVDRALDASMLHGHVVNGVEKKRAVQKYSFLPKTI